MSAVDASILASVLLAPHDHPGWSRLRCELLAAYVGVPLPEPVRVASDQWRTKRGAYGRLQQQLQSGAQLSRQQGYAITANFDHYIYLLRRRGWPIECVDGIYALDSHRDRV